MQDFIGSLVSETKNAEVPEEYDFFGKLIGGWDVEYVDRANARSIKGEWHFARVLDGMAVQDVIVLPGFECGTTIRVYNPVSRAWDIAYCYTGRIMRLEARKQGGQIVLTVLDDPKRKWVFAEIGERNFHWQDIRVRDDGAWEAVYDLFAERK